MTIGYRYLQPQLAGRASIAFDQVKNEDGTTTYYAAMCYCGPLDRYVKHYGRDKARGRLVRLMSSADGYRFAERFPDKYQIVHVQDGEKETVDDFLDVIEEIVAEFIPTAVFMNRKDRSQY